jgi:hypothetical protein
MWWLSNRYILSRNSCACFGGRHRVIELMVTLWTPGWSTKPQMVQQKASKNKIPTFHLQTCKGNENTVPQRVRLHAISKMVRTGQLCNTWPKSRMPWRFWGLSWGGQSLCLVHLRIWQWGRTVEVLAPDLQRGHERRQGAYHRPSQMDQASSVWRRCFLTSCI